MTFEYTERRASINAYDVSELPVSVSVGLNDLSILYIWVIWVNSASSLGKGMKCIARKRDGIPLKRWI